MYWVKKTLIIYLCLVLLPAFAVTQAHAGPMGNVTLRITFENPETNRDGVHISPIFFAFHDGSFDPFSVGDDVNGTQFAEFVKDATGRKVDADAAFSAIVDDADRDALRFSLPGSGRDTDISNGGQFDPGQSRSVVVNIDTATQDSLFVYGAVLPSSDAFFANQTPLSVSDILANGGEYVFFYSTDVYDSGTEDNGVRTADFINTPGITPTPAADPNNTIELIQTLNRYYDDFSGLILFNSGNAFIPPPLPSFDLRVGVIRIEVLVDVPEPAMIGIFGLGLIGLYAARRRRLKRC